MRTPRRRERVTHAGRTKNDVVSFGQIRRIKNLLQFLGKSLLDRLFLFFLVSRPHHRLKIAAQASNRGCRQHGFRCSSYARVKIDTAPRDRRCDRGSDIPIGNHSNHGVRRSDRLDESGVSRAIEHDHRNILDPLPQRLGNNRNDLFNRVADRHYVDPCSLHVANDLHAIGQLHHVKGRNIFERSLGVCFGRRGSQAADRPGQTLWQRSSCHQSGPRPDQIYGCRASRCQDVPLKNPRSIILDALTDDHFAANIHQIEHPPDRVARGSVSFFFFTSADPRQRVQSRRFGGPNKVKLDDSFQVFDKAADECAWRWRKVKLVRRKDSSGVH